MIGAFSDLNNDGNIEECVGLTVYQNGFFHMGLWETISTTDEIDGLSEQSDLYLLSKFFWKCNCIQS